MTENEESRLIRPFIVSELFFICSPLSSRCEFIDSREPSHLNVAVATKLIAAYGWAMTAYSSSGSSEVECCERVALDVPVIVMTTNALIPLPSRLVGTRPRHRQHHLYRPAVIPELVITEPVSVTRPACLIFCYVFPPESDNARTVPYQVRGSQLSCEQTHLSLSRLLFFVGAEFVLFLDHQVFSIGIVKYTYRYRVCLMQLCLEIGPLSESETVLKCIDRVVERL
ncbi:hypothetical protein J6590_028018 [Homalodisca vitripennis]|nr:hypothetical protein J6590_028018 [Homalodisca vitripennis]